MLDVVKVFNCLFVWLFKTFKISLLILHSIPKTYSAQFEFVCQCV